jgi:hypothetical protein
MLWMAAAAGLTPNRIYLSSHGAIGRRDVASRGWVLILPKPLETRAKDFVFL